MVSDTLTRYYRAKGYETFYLTGTDEHGDKIAQRRRGATVSEKEFTDRVSAAFRPTWDNCGITTITLFAPPTPIMCALCRKILQRVYDAGDVYFDKYGGPYCVGCERFYTEKELRRRQMSGSSDGTRRSSSEKNYFFRMGKYQHRLSELSQPVPTSFAPSVTAMKCLAFCASPSAICASRGPRAGCNGVFRMPFDVHYVTYVWFDALLNYVSALECHGGESFREIVADGQPPHRERHP